MPSGVYTTDATPSGLVASVTRTAHIPLSQNTFQNTDICAMADEELKTSLLSQILAVREGYFLGQVDLTATSTGVYQIPSRAIGGRVHAVSWVVGTLVFPLARIEPADLTNTLNPPTNSYAFYLQGNSIVTLPIITSGVLRVWCYIRPSLLNSSTSGNCAQVTAIGPTTVTVSTAAANIATNTVVDFTQDQPPFGLLAFDKTCTNATGTTYTFASGDIPSTLAVGDWVCVAGYSPIPQIPEVFHPLLAQRVVVKVLEAQGSLQKLDKAQAKLLEMEKAVGLIINPRDEGNPKVITPNRSLVRRGPGRRGTWYIAP